MCGMCMLCAMHSQCAVLPAPSHSYWSPSFNLYVIVAAAAQEAYAAIPGMLVGVLFMLLYGVVLLTYLSSLFARTSTEVDLTERLGLPRGEPPPILQKLKRITSSTRTSAQSRSSRPSGQPPSRSSAGSSARTSARSSLPVHVREPPPRY
jgi:hypothetical protein